MVLRKIPMAGTPLKAGDFFEGFKSGLAGEKSGGKFEDNLAGFLRLRHCFNLSCGYAAFYVILKSLQKLSDRKEVILPAYTASGLVVALKKAGLKPVLCDISLETFNLDIEHMDIISENTLCIVPVHLFGLPADVGKIQISLECRGKRSGQSKIFIVEDSAQALGTSLNGKMVGTRGDVGFYSFNRGKNFPTYSGGCIAADSEELCSFISKEINLLKKPSLLSNILLPVKLFLLSIAVNPFMYRLFYPFIAVFKSTEVSTDIDLSKYTSFQAGVGISLLKRLDSFSRLRYQNGMKLIEGLRGIDEIILPGIPDDSIMAFNRLPVVFKDLKFRDHIEKEFKCSNIETSRMYLRPLHHIFDLGYPREAFPNAVYFAERLLTLPTHPLVNDSDINRMIEIFRSY